MNVNVTNSSFRKILVLCVDVDDDLGRKTGIRGPVIGKEENLKAATALAVADPTEADANAIFGAVRVYEETKREAPEAEVEIVTITGHPKTDLRADQEIIRQMDAVTERFRPDFIVLVSDGADDERVIPLLLRYCQTISVRRVIVQQSRNLEETYFLLKRYIDKLLESPGTRAIALGVPGTAIFLAALFYLLGLQRFFLVGVGLTTGILLLDRAFNIVGRVASIVNYFGRDIGAISFVVGLIGLLTTSGMIYNEATSLANRFTAYILIAKIMEDSSLMVAASMAIMFLGSFVEKVVKHEDPYERLLGALMSVLVWPALKFSGEYLLGRISLETLFFVEVFLAFAGVGFFFVTLKLKRRASLRERY